MERSIQAFADDFVWVKVDIDRQVSLAREWQVEATPTIFLLGPGGEIRRKIVGFLGADKLAAAMHGALERPGGGASPGEAPVIQVHQSTSLTEAPGGFLGPLHLFFERRLRPARDPQPVAVHRGLPRSFLDRSERPRPVAKRPEFHLYRTRRRPAGFHSR